MFFLFLGLGVPQSNNPKIHSFRVVSAREAAVNDIDLLSPSSITATNTSTTGNNISVSPEKTQQQLSKTSSTSNQTKIHKPILMCFICKLSFGNTKSFTLHASTEHQLNLQESEKLLLSREYSSAILQRNNDEKPQLSFLEPLEQQQQQQQSPSLVSMKQQQELQQKLINDFVQQIQKQAIAANSNNNNDHQQQISDQSTAMLLNNSSSSSSLIKSPNHLPHNSSSSSNNTSSTSPSSSSHAKHNNNSGTDNSSSANNNTNNNLTNSSSSVMNSQQQSSSQNQQNSPSSSSSALVANNSSSSSSATQQQQQLLASTNAAAAAKLLSEFLHQQQQQFQRSLQCPEHQGQQGVDCKNCEMLNIGLRSPLTPSKSPNSSVGGDMNLTSPTTSTPLPSGGTHLNLSPGAPSFTIGACPEHINGRPIGVECARLVPVSYFIHFLTFWES